MARDGEHFFMCFLDIWISSFEKVLFSSVAHFFIGSLFFGEFSFLSSLYILVVSPLSDV
jgi:type IV secretory pathway TrbL component